MNSLTVLDVVCADKFHLPDDNVYYVHLLANCFDRVVVESSPTVAERLGLLALPNVEAHRTVFHRSGVGRWEGPLYLLRMLMAPDRVVGGTVLMPVLYEPAYVLRLLLGRAGAREFAVLHNNVTVTKGAGLKARTKRALLRFVLRRLRGIIVFTEAAHADVLAVCPDLQSDRLHIVPLYMAGRVRPRTVARGRRLLVFGADRVEGGVDRVRQMAVVEALGHQRGITVHGKGVRRLVDVLRYVAAGADLETVDGYLTSAEYHGLIQISGFVVLPYDRSYEGRLSGIFCDAISNGTPVVAPRFPPFTEYFDRFGVLGVLVDFEEPDWAERLATELGEFDERAFEAASLCARAAHSDDAVRAALLRALTPETF